MKESSLKWVQNQAELPDFEVSWRARLPALQMEAAGKTQSLHLHYPYI